MSAGNPDRAQRPRPRVDYTSNNLDTELSNALKDYGDESSLDLASAPKSLDVNENRNIDKTFRPSRVVDSDDSDDSDEYDSEELAEDEDGKQMRLARKKKKEKSDAEVGAEQAVARGLSLSYPDGFKMTRRGLRYASIACSMGTRYTKQEGVRYALSRVFIDDALTPDDRELVISMAEQIGNAIRVPKQYLADTFEPLSNFNGGVYTKTGQNMAMLCAIAMGVHMAAELPEFRAKGSAQAQGFAEVLGVAGLGGDIVSMLTKQHTNETPEQSARNCALKIVEQLNAQTDHDLVASLYYNIANFPQRARTMMAGRELKCEYDYTLFDNTKPKGWTTISKQKSVVSVSLTLLHRTLESDPYSKFLAEVQGPEAAPHAAGYKPCYSFPDSNFVPTGSQETDATYAANMHVQASMPDELKTAIDAYEVFFNDATGDLYAQLGGVEFDKCARILRCKANDLRAKLVSVERTRLLADEEAKYKATQKALGEYVETHRAQVDITPFTGSMTNGRAEVVNALKSMLLSTTCEQKEIAKKLKCYLTSLPQELVARKEKSEDDLDPKFSNYWGAGTGAYLGIKADGVACRLGRRGAFHRTIHVTGQGNLHLGVENQCKKTQLQNWLKLDHDVTTKCLREFIQPWKLKGPGTIEFCLLMTATPPEDYISLRIPRHVTYYRQCEEWSNGAHLTLEFLESISKFKKACYAESHKGRNPKDIEKKRLNDAEKHAMDILYADAYKQAYRTYEAEHPFKDRDAFNMNYRKKDLCAQTAGETSAKRKQVRQDAEVTKFAKQNHKHVMAAHPTLGGSEICNTTGFGCD